MKKLALVLLFMPVVAFSQQGLDPQMMEKLQEMATCMSTVDQKEIKQLEKNSKKFEKEIKGLCKSGKRDDAQKRAIEFSQKMMKSSVLITIRKCTENLPASLKGMVPDMSADKIAKNLKDKHVCDEI